jgi:molecular chaperone GrpE
MIEETKQPETTSAPLEEILDQFETTDNGQSSSPYVAADSESPLTDESEKKVTEEPRGVEGVEQTPEKTIAQLQEQIENLKQEIAEKEEQVDGWKKRHITLAAEFDNYRKRTQREMEEMEILIKRKTISEILPVVDNFERARTQLKPANDGEMAIHKSYQGVYKNLVDNLKRLGVAPMRPEGQLFDPNYHEAMLSEPTNDHPEGTVVEQLVRGYLIGEQVLRHAMVKVAAPKETGSHTEAGTSEVEGQTNNV